MLNFNNRKTTQKTGCGFFMLQYLDWQIFVKPRYGVHFVTFLFFLYILFDTFQKDMIDYEWTKGDNPKVQAIER